MLRCSVLIIAWMTWRGVTPTNDIEAPTTPSEYTSAPDGYEYRLHSEQLPFDEAVVVCQHDRGNLANIKSEEAYQYLIEQYKDENIWINLRRGPFTSAKKSSFKWGDNSSANQVWMQGKWATGAPNGFAEYCVRMNAPRPYLNDMDCQATYKFLCQRKLQAPISVPHGTSSASASDDKYKNFEHKKRLNDHLGIYNGVYQKYIPPPTPDGEPVVIKMDPQLIRILSIDQIEQVMHCFLWIRQHWVDRRLSWNETEYGGVTKIHIESAAIWLPDTTIYDSVSGDKDERNLEKHEARMTVQSDGYVRWLRPIVTRTTCFLDLKNFPFDDQICMIVFGSWNFNKQSVDYKINRQGSEYKEGQRWDVIDQRLIRKVDTYPSGQYVTIQMYLDIRRRSLNPLLNFVIPSALLFFLSALAFMLPVESNEKITFCITLLLATTVFQQLTQNSLPDDQIPLTTKYYLAVFIGTAINLIVTVGLIRMYHTNHFSMSHRTRRFVLGFLRKVLLMKPRKQQIDLEELRKDQEKKYRRVSQCHGSSESQINSVEENGKRHNDTSVVFRRDRLTVPTSQVGTEEMERLRDLIKKSADEILQEEWKLVGRVLGRFFMVIFVIFNFLILIVIFGQASRFQKEDHAQSHIR